MAKSAAVISAYFLILSLSLISAKPKGRSVSAFRLAVNMPNGLICEDRHSRQRSKRRRGDETPAPFCCPSLKVMDVDLELVAAFTRRARDISAYYANLKGGSFYRCAALCIIFRYVECRHTQQPAQPTTPYQNDVRARHVQTTTAPAACEPQALGEVLSRRAQW